MRFGNSLKGKPFYSDEMKFLSSNSTDMILEQGSNLKWELFDLFARSGIVMYIYYVDLLQDSEMNGCWVDSLLCSILLVDVFNMHAWKAEDIS